MANLFSNVLQAVERGAFPRVQKWGWRLLYNILSRFWRDRDWRFMNYGFVPAGAPFPLKAEDEDERAFIGLYQQAVEGLPVEGARVLEVGSGRGGGSRYIARYHAPASVIGLDYSPETVRLAQKLNGDAASLSFQTGDAERLPFPDNSFDLVLNIESSHCYADVGAFAREVSRVLKPGGWFTFADMRAKGTLSELNSQLTVPGLEMITENNISSGVVSALDAADKRKRERIGKAWMMQRFMTEFAGAKGSILYKGLVGGKVVYIARRYRKVG